MDIMGPFHDFGIQYVYNAGGRTCRRPQAMKNQEEPPQIDEAVQLIVQTVLLVAQCCNTISYEGRKNVLSTVTVISEGEVRLC